MGRWTLSVVSGSAGPRVAVRAFAAILALAAFFVPAILSAQVSSEIGRRTSGFRIEFQKPSFDDAGYGFGSIPRYSATTGILTLSCFARVGERTVVVFEAPWTHVDYEHGPVFGPGSRVSESASLLGNPYLGAEIGNREGTRIFEAGFRLPVANESRRTPFVSQAATIADYERFEAFLEDCLSASLHGNLRSPAGPGAIAHVRGGVLYLRPIDGGDGEDESRREDQFRFDAGISLGYRTTSLEFRGGITLGGPFQDPDNGLTRRVVDHASVGVFAIRPGIRPGAFVRFPLEPDLADAVNMTFGLNLALDLR
jgi:hypothetical protein